MAYKSGNPALSNKTFENLNTDPTAEAMTLDGVATKSLIMLALCVSSGYVGWRIAAQDNLALLLVVFVAIFVAFGIAILTGIKPKLSPITAPLYAIVEGFVLGAISQIYEAEYQGIVLQALLLTGGVFASMLFIYRARIIRATQNFKLGVASATGGIAIYYLIGLCMSLFGKEIPLIHSNSWFGIGFTLFVIVVAALNLVVDFDFIEKGVEKRAPKYMEWYSSFGLFVTVVWLYLEILRLLSKLRSR